jgi:hypothetical protein
MPKRPPNPRCHATALPPTPRRPPRAAADVTPATPTPARAAAARPAAADSGRAPVLLLKLAPIPAARRSAPVAVTAATAPDADPAARRCLSRRRPRPTTHVEALNLERLPDHRYRIGPGAANGHAVADTGLRQGFDRATDRIRGFTAFGAKQAK